MAERGVDGRYEELPDLIGHKREREHAWSLLSQHANWWEPGGLKPVVPPTSNAPLPVFFRIAVEHCPAGKRGNEHVPVARHELSDASRIGIEAVIDQDFARRRMTPAGHRSGPLAARQTPLDQVDHGKQVGDAVDDVVGSRRRQALHGFGPHAVRTAGGEAPAYRPAKARRRCR